MKNVPHASYSPASAIFMILAMGYFIMCPLQNVVKLYSQVTMIEEETMKILEGIKHSLEAMVVIGAYRR